MCTIPDNVRQDLVTLIPAALIDEISCFVLYDKHPRDDTLTMDITICTLCGELREYFQREKLCSILISGCMKPTDVKILRNSKCELFYLVACGDEIVILSRKEKLNIIHRINNVDSYDVQDFDCSGRANLKIICKDDAVPLFLDDNFESIKDRSELKKPESDDNVPVITQLARKYTEAKYSVKYNEKALRDLVHLRQLTSNDTRALKRSTATGSPLYLTRKLVFVAKSMNKIVLILELINKSVCLLEDVHYLIHNSVQPSLNYHSKILESVITPPFWKKSDLNTVCPNCSVCLAVVVDFKELKYSTTCRFNLSGEISYKLRETGHLSSLPVTNIWISATEIVEGNLKLQANMQPKNMNLVAHLAAIEKIDLILRHIKREEESDLNLTDLLCKYIKMEQIADNMVYLNSPYHVLDGLLIHEKSKVTNYTWIISVHYRSPDQVLAFIHYMHDAVPYRIIITTVNQNIKAKTHNLSMYNENKEHPQTFFNYREYAKSVVEQADLTLQYFDECMCKMNDCKNVEIRNKIGKEIDIYAGGESSFKTYKQKVLEKAQNSIQNTCDLKNEPMIIELD